jgi:IS5 family transposase
MGKLIYNQMSFFSSYVEKRKIKDDFFRQINCIINWDEISKILEKYYLKGESVSGRKSYPALLLFKISLLQTWYGLSDYEVERQVNDRISFMKFCGLRFEDDVPDHSAICRFRKELTNKKAHEVLLNVVNSQLEKHSILVKQGAIIDASITPTERKPKGKKTFAITEEEPLKLKQIDKKGVDKEGSWTKKSGKLHYGYKKHYLCDEETSIVLSVVTSTAKDHDSKYLEKCISKASLSKGSKILADKGYFGQPNEEILKKRGLKSMIQKKAVRGKALTYWEKERNKIISKTRYRVERIFGGIKRWFKSGICRYVGLLKTHGQHVLEAIAYNLKITPGLIIKKSKR